MRISFQHANPQAGNEAVLLRFHTLGTDTPCVLIDAGAEVDLDALLDEQDRLAAICLSHAHLDHYADLASAYRDDAPIYTSPATATILDDVLDVAAHEYDVASDAQLRAAVTPLDGWTEITERVSVHAVPVGHAPGAVGFLFRVTDGDEIHRLFATGDWTRRAAGQYPGLAVENLPDIDAVFLTGATSTGFESALTEAVGTVLERARAGSRTLLATSGLTGVQVGAVLGGACSQFDLDVPIRLVGQVAKLYDRLDYDHATVETIPEFESTEACLDPGVVTVAGPEIPRERSSGRLFGVLRDDPSACVVQLIGSGESPVVEARCTLHDYELVNHPTEASLEAVHDALDPVETIITHRHGGAKSEFNHLDSVVWGAGTTQEFTLYDGYHWKLPPWMGGGIVPRDMTASAGEDGERARPADLPTVARTESVDLDAEGIDVEELAETLHEPVPATQESLEQTGGSRGRASSDGGTTPAGETTELVPAGDVEGDSGAVDAVTTDESDGEDGVPSLESGTTDSDSEQRVGNPQAVTVSPIAVALLDETDEEAVARRVEEAVEEYLLALLAGTARGDDAERLEVSVELSPALEAVLGSGGPGDVFGAGVDEEFVEAWLAARVGTTDEPTTVSLSAASVEQIAAVVHNDEFAFETVAEVVDAAVLWACGRGESGDTEDLRFDA
jgi:putative mRNA 3-end processing factor